MSTERTVDIEYLAYQYGDAEKLRTRYETHSRYSVRKDSFLDWVIDLLQAAPGMLVLDAGCGPGTYHPRLSELGALVVGTDRSRGMLRDATRLHREHSLRGHTVQADAETLPFRDGSFPRVMANHMLYHVDDRQAALSELRRVTRAGGRVVLATNARNETSPLVMLHARAAVDCGFTPLPLVSWRFSLDDLPLVRSVFPGARVFRRDDAFVFPTAEPFLAYYASYQVDEIAERTMEGHHREALLRRVRELVDEAIAQHGELRISKDAGCFVADV